MNILSLDWQSYCSDQAEEAMERMGHKIYKFAHLDYQLRKSEAFEKAFYEFVDDNHIDIAFSYNYYPVLAESCKNKNIKYISFLYDSPYVMLYSYTLMYPTNYVFVFDSSLFKQFRDGGLTNVYYMVLPTDPLQYEKQSEKFKNSARLKSDISFMGQLYNEEHLFYDKMEAVGDEYLNGYLRGVIEAQLKVYGYNFADKVITPDIRKRLYRAFPYDVQSPGVEPDNYIYADYLINRKATSIERNRFITAIGERFPDRLKLFTWNEKATFVGVKNMGIATYENEMPVVFHESKINLNISLRSIKTGIPLRCMDIMGSHGLLLSNYQQDLVDAFIPGEEFVCYESEEDMLNKIDYLLSHEAERKEIAENGYQKVKNEYNFETVFSRIFEIVLG